MLSNFGIVTVAISINNFYSDDVFYTFENRNRYQRFPRAGASHVLDSLLAPVPFSATFLCNQRKSRDLLFSVAEMDPFSVT